MFDLKDKVALITGASRGIDRSIACKFAQAGAKVIVNYAKNELEARKTIELMGEYKNNAIALGFDVSNPKDVEDAIDNIINKYNSLDILVNNAGITVDGLIMRLKAEDFDRQIATNLKGSFNCIKAVVRPMMKKRYGRIINISSVVGQSGNAGQSIYAAAKAGLIGMTKSLALELGSRNILVNAIAPGYIATDMTKDILDRGQEKIISQIPLGRIGEPDDIANSALFLASEYASYITGQVLSVNGGIYL